MRYTVFCQHYVLDFTRFRLFSEGIQYHFINFRLSITHIILRTKLASDQAHSAPAASVGFPLVRWAIATRFQGILSLSAELPNRTNSPKGRRWYLCNVLSRPWPLSGFTRYTGKFSVVPPQYGEQNSADLGVCVSLLAPNFWPTLGPLELRPDAWWKLPSKHQCANEPLARTTRCLIVLTIILM